MFRSGFDIWPSSLWAVCMVFLVSTVSRVSAWRGGSVTIPCFYGDRYKTHVKYWCRGDYRDACTPIVHSDSPQEGKVSIRDDPDQRVFTLTINNLTAGDSGYYSCGVKIRRERRPGCALARSGQCIWLHTPQTGGHCPHSPSCPREE
uniref:Ig-like domain-containing protein n=1 Tax=Paramormyrops kingsleyae TaxID=1676925 RepID=A0A3B3T973_9TELE